VNQRLIRTPAERRLGYLRVLEARSPSTSTERLRVLATDSIRPVRLWTARNPNTPPDALGSLTEDEDPWVQWNALLHPHTPAAALQTVADEEAATARSRRFIIVHHPNTSPALRAELIAAGACPTCPDEACDGFRPFRRRARSA
jgi:hypothetical protein